ncbi:alpha-glucoside permease [Paramyrothecium foliicola]|nr:alpha-glucoside permease [Paramyrothecium foliicola]
MLRDIQQQDGSFSTVPSPASRDKPDMDRYVTRSHQSIESLSSIDGLELLDLAGASSQASRTLGLTQMLVLTSPSFGLQACWFLLTSSGTPYLISLGIPKSIIPLVWATGPFFGAFAQPVFGILSDESRHRWGKRKPFMIYGSASATIFLLALAYSSELTNWMWHSNRDSSHTTFHWQTQIVAVFSVFMATFALAAYTVGVKALIVDNSPPSQQSTAASWAMRWNVLGNVVLSTVGFVDTQWSIFADEGNARFKILTIVVAVCTATTVGLACFLVSDERSSAARGNQAPLMEVCQSIISPIGLAKKWAQLPPRSRRICEIQIYASAGWFPVLYYMSTRREMGQLDAALVEEARSYGFFASFAFALGAFFASVALQTLDYAKPALTRNLSQVWLASQCFLGYCMHLTFVARSGAIATLVVSMMGATAAVTMWIPYAIISDEVSELSAGKPDGDVAWILGLHNMAISLPQIGSTLMCALLLAALKSLHVEDSVAWVFRLASVPVFSSAYLIYKS